jgi:hypothetical protein
MRLASSLGWFRRFHLLAKDFSNWAFSITRQGLSALDVENVEFELTSMQTLHHQSHPSKTIEGCWAVRRMSICACAASSIFLVAQPQGHQTSFVEIPAQTSSAQFLLAFERIYGLAFSNNVSVRHLQTPPILPLRLDGWEVASFDCELQASEQKGTMSLKLYGSLRIAPHAISLLKVALMFAPGWMDQRSKFLWTRRCQTGWFHAELRRRVLDSQV